MAIMAITTVIAIIETMAMKGYDSPCLRPFQSKMLFLIVLASKSR